MTDRAVTVRRARLVSAAATLLGTAVLLAAGVWWWLVFRQIVLNSYMSMPRALPCLVGESVVCRLAQALCTSGHFLGIRRYYVGIFWVGSGLVAVGLMTRRLAFARLAGKSLLVEGK